MLELYIDDSSKFQKPTYVLLFEKKCDKILLQFEYHYSVKYVVNVFSFLYIERFRQCHQSSPDLDKKAEELDFQACSIHKAAESNLAGNIFRKDR